MENGEPCHVFMLTNELITQPLIYLSLCHFTGMLQQSNACRLWVISWQLKANYSSNSTTHQALNHKCCNLSICLLSNLLSQNWAAGFKFTRRLQHLAFYHLTDGRPASDCIYFGKKVGGNFFFLPPLPFPCRLNYQCLIKSSNHIGVFSFYSSSNAQ